MDVRNIVVVQLDGPTELLASVPAIRGLKRAHPNSKITLISSTKTAELNPFIPADRYIVADDFAGKVPAIGLDEPKRVDLLVNLGFSEASCGISSDIKAKTKIGPYWNSDKHVCLEDGWTRFHEAIKYSDEPSGFHVIELLSSIAGVQWTNSDFLLNSEVPAVESARRHLQPHEHLKVAIMPGAVPPESVRQMIKTLHDCGFQIHFYLVGTLRERAAAQEIIDDLGSASDACTNLTGIIPLSELIAMFYLCDIAIGSPGISALASSGFGTLNFCYLPRTAQNFSSLPYGAGHLVFQPETSVDLIALGDLLAETVAYAITRNTGNTPDQSQWKDFFDARIEGFIGTIRVHLTALLDSTHESGTKADPILHPLLFSGYTGNDITRLFHRKSWESILNESEVRIGNIDLLSPDAINDLGSVVPTVEAMVTACSFGIHYSSSIRQSIQNNDLPAAQETGQKLQEIDELIRRLSESDNRFSAMVDYFLINQNQIFDIDPISVSNKVLLCYTLLSHQAMLILNLYRDLLSNISTPAASLERAAISMTEVDTNG